MGSDDDDDDDVRLNEAVENGYLIIIHSLMWWCVCVCVCVCVCARACVHACVCVLCKLH